MIVDTSLIPMVYLQHKYNLSPEQYAFFSHFFVSGLQFFSEQSSFISHLSSISQISLKQFISSLKPFQENSFRSHYWNYIQNYKETPVKIISCVRRGKKDKKL